MPNGALYAICRVGGVAAVSPRHEIRGLSKAQSCVVKIAWDDAEQSISAEAAVGG